MNKIDAVRPVRDAKAQAALAPVQKYLAELRERISELTGGKPADYIPELGKVDPNPVSYTHLTLPTTPYV